jgi:hypothetical protein
MGAPRPLLIGTMLPGLGQLPSDIRFQRSLPYRPKKVVVHRLGLAALHRRFHHRRSQFVYLDRANHHAN